MPLIIAFGLGAAVALVYAAIRHEAAEQTERRRRLATCTWIMYRCGVDGVPEAIRRASWADVTRKIGVN